MSSQHIEVVSSASRLGSDFRSLIDRTRELQALATKVKDISDQVASGGDWDALGTKLGLTAAQAQAAYNMLGDFSSAVNAAGVVNTFVDRLG